MNTIQDIPKETHGAGISHSPPPKPRSEAKSKVRGRSFTRLADWHTVALVTAGIAAGAVLGAGIALLMAPQSGAHTRLALSQELRRRRPWRTGPWDALGEELHKAAHRRNSRHDFRGIDEDL